MKADVIKDVELKENKEVMIRRYKSNIMSSGRYYILFGIWSILRNYILLTMNKDLVDQLVPDPDSFGEAAWIFKLVYAGTLIIMFSIEMAFHLFIGIRAIRYCTGKTQKTGFLVLAVIMILVVVLEEIVSFSYVDKIQDTLIADLLLNTAVIFLLSDMVYSAIRMKKLMKEPEV